MQKCVFCRIISGDVPSYKIYENGDVLAFLDANPSTPGHTLLIPKTHTQRLEELSEKDSISLFMALHKLVGDIQSAMKAPSSTIGINNGSEAGQEVPHIHIHIIPRRSREDGGIIQTVVHSSERPKRSDFMRIAGRIREETGWRGKET